MKFAVLLVVFAVCGTLAEPFNPFNIVHQALQTGKNAARGGINLAGNAVNGGLNLAGNVLDGFFGHGHGQNGHGKGGGKGDGKGVNQAGVGDNSEIEIIISLIPRIGTAISSGNWKEAETLVQQLLQALQKLQKSISGSGQNIITVFIQLVQRLQAAIKSKNKDTASSIFIQIQNQAKQLSGSAGKIYNFSKINQNQNERKSNL